MNLYFTYVSHHANPLFTASYLANAIFPNNFSLQPKFSPRLKAKRGGVEWSTGKYSRLLQEVEMCLGRPFVNIFRKGGYENDVLIIMPDKLKSYFVCLNAG